MFTFLTRQAKPIMMQMPNRVNRGQQ
jgi:hypothetical protein